MTKEMTLAELINELPPTIDPGKFTADLLQAITRLRRRPLDVYYAGPRSLRVDGVTMMVDLQPKQAVIIHFNGHQVNVQVPL
jgi:hypothetical protein